MKLSDFLLFEIYLTPFALLYAIYKVGIYRTFGLKKLSKIIEENSFNLKKVRIIKIRFYLFWILIYIFILYLFVLLVVFTGHWNEI